MEIQKPEQQKSESARKPTEPDKNSPKTTPPIVKEAPSEAAKPKPSERSDEGSNEPSADWWMVKLTAVLAFIGFWQLVVFGLQARRLKQTIEAMKKIGADQSRDMQGSISAAQNAADAAQNQVALSREAMITTERAFVFCERINSHWTANAENEEIVKWTFIPSLKNSGKTPTKRARGQINSWVDAGELPVDIDYTKPDNAEQTMIGPYATMHGWSLDIPIETLQKMRAGIAHAYIWGWLDYDDIFAKTDRHRTEFCLEIEVTGNPIHKTGGFAYRMHGPFNGFDEECYCKPKPYE